MPKHTRHLRSPSSIRAVPYISPRVDASRRRYNADQSARYYASPRRHSSLGDHVFSALVLTGVGTFLWGLFVGF